MKTIFEIADTFTAKLAEEDPALARPKQDTIPPSTESDPQGSAAFQAYESDIDNIVVSRNLFKGIVYLLENVEVGGVLSGRKNTALAELREILNGLEEGKDTIKVL